MEKFILLSDTHLSHNTPSPYGWNTWDRLKICLAHIQKEHSDAKALILLGDIINKNEPISTYDKLNQLLIPLGKPCILLLGNHDNFAMRTALSGATATTFEQLPLGLCVPQCLQSMHTQWVFAHTHLQGHIDGALSCEDAHRLSQAIHAAEMGQCGKNVLFFAHHPPFHSHIPVIDALKMAPHTALLEAAQKCHPWHGPRLMAFFGHTHRAITALWHGIPMMSVRGLTPEIALNQPRGWEESVLQGPLKILAKDTAPAYNVLFLDYESTQNDIVSVAVHAEEFLYAGNEFPL